jgi:hypothetical protein
MIKKSASEGDTTLVGEPYERPEVTPIGNLNELLAATTGSGCDAPAETGTDASHDLCG